MFDNMFAHRHIVKRKKRPLFLVGVFLNRALLQILDIHYNKVV